MQQKILSIETKNLIKETADNKNKDREREMKIKELLRKENF
jgi:hypothetical protein